ncbi:MAG: SRPBCC family protein [Actinomycetes bacterium]
MDDVRVTETIAADSTAVYDLIGDVTRMGEVSPETTSCRWLDGADGPRVGARFRGSNKYGLRRWSTTCTVTAAEPGRRFAFSVTFGGVAISDWAYGIARTKDGCRVTETWVDRRPAWMRISSVPLMGIVDRGGHNRAGMRSTLAALKAAAEAPDRGRQPRPSGSNVTR